MTSGSIKTGLLRVSRIVLYVHKIYFYINLFMVAIKYDIKQEAL